jgi:hypothetical protein
MSGADIAPNYMTRNPYHMTDEYAGAANAAAAVQAVVLTTEITCLNPMYTNHLLECSVQLGRAAVVGHVYHV